MATGEKPPPKKDVARALLLRGSAFVYLDPRPDEVLVPPWLSRQAQLVLQIGLDLPVQIPDLRVDERGVFGTLSFNRSPFTCSVPWSAVFGLVGDDGMGMVWPDDMPSEIAAEVEAAARRHRPPEAPHLKAIDGGSPSVREKAEKAEKTAGDAEGETNALSAVSDVEEPSSEEHLGPAAAVLTRQEQPHKGQADDAMSDEDEDEDETDASDGQSKRSLPPYLRVIK